MSAITELGYMAIGVSNLNRWKEFATEILGLELVDEGEPKRCYLRMDFWHHRLIVEENGSDDLTCLGLRVAGPEEFAGMRKVLSDAGEEEAAAAVKCFQFRDLRAKAGTDKADATDMREAQQQLGHKSVKTNEIYLRARAGEKVTPTK